MAKHHPDLIFCRKQPGIEIKALYSAVHLHSASCTSASDFFTITAANLPQRLLAIGRLCEKHDGVCVICDSLVRPADLVRICDECNYGTYVGRCVVCGGPGVSDAYYCKECVIQEKDVCVASPKLQSHKIAADNSVVIPSPNRSLIHGAITRLLYLNLPGQHAAP
ncbi:hypothetical protein BSLG_008707 [Batrachochytrium salamandrivorans]|nr:hypothetical protein BSLG_008707 [Batrachochytrium salamandrivorans]